MQCYIWSSAIMWFWVRWMFGFLIVWVRLCGVVPILCIYFASNKLPVFHLKHILFWHLFKGWLSTIRFFILSYWVHFIQHYIICGSRNVVYIVECFLCALQYVDCTVRPLRTRIGEHYNDSLNPNARNKTKVSKHFRDMKKKFGGSSCSVREPHWVLTIDTLFLRK